MATDPNAAAPSGRYVLLEKGTPQRVLTPQVGAPDTRQNPLDTSGFNSIIVDALPGQGAPATSITVLGAPTPGGPWIQEVDPNAFQSGVVAPKRFIVTGTSAYVAVALSAPAGWTVWLTPFNAASQTNVSITGTPATNLAQYGGVAVGPANPVDTRQAGAVDVSDRAGRALGAVTGTVAVSGAVTTTGTRPVQPVPTTWSLSGTSAANAAQTVTQAAAGVGVRNYLSGLTVSWSGGAPAAGASVQIKDGSTVIWESYIGRVNATQDNNDFEFTQPIASSPNASLSVTVAAGGAGVTTKVSAQGTTGP